MTAENAAARDNFVSGLYESAVKQEKEIILSTYVTPEQAQLHRSGAIHLHDLEGYRYVYNCCTPDLTTILNPAIFSATNDFGRIAEVFEKIKTLISNLAVCQTGGIGFANFDGDIASTLERLGVKYSQTTQEIMQEMMHIFISWVNDTRTRYCREPYYLSLNIGLAVSDWGRFVTRCVIASYQTQGMEMTRPNIIFKVKEDINGKNGTVNYDLFQMALKCTAKKMVPTYLLMDSAVNAACIPERLGIMGCRTRVYQNSNGNEGTVGRGNIAYVSINLPRLALQSQSITDFEDKMHKKALICKEILLKRMEILRSSNKLDFIFKNKIWTNAASVEELTKQGTLSLGFIGLAETVEILCGKKMHHAKEAEQLGFHIVSLLRSYVDYFRKETDLNFSLLATPGEMISGKFAEADRKLSENEVVKKEFYTNSFHTEVDSGTSLWTKIKLEGKFHQLCNGGSISYVEFNDAPLDNLEALEDLIHYAAEQGVSYLGFNYPLDICLDCNTHGTFDTCTCCSSNHIKRIRRVSGYLEDLEYFTPGKIREVGYRLANLSEKY